MKKYALILLVALFASAAEARRWGRRGGWGWGGPAFGVGFSVPIGGSKYAPEAPYKAGDPYYKYRSYFPKSDPVKNRKAYRRWLFSNYPSSVAQHWWNFFLNYRYNPYQASKPRSSAYFSIGGGGYPYYGYPYGYYGRPYWGGYGGGVGIGFGF